tara:strand:- start:450 stop:1058 length:609 start_codon:yes stop_codon:yes gene_type:complete
MIGLGVGGYFYFSDDKCDEITDKTDCSDNENCKWDSSDSVCVKKCNSIDNSSDCNDNDHCNWNSSDSVCEIYTPPTDNTPTDDNLNSDPSGENLPNTSTVNCGEGLEIDPSNPESCRVISSTADTPTDDNSADTNTNTDSGTDPETGGGEDANVCEQAVAKECARVKNEAAGNSWGDQEWNIIGDQCCLDFGCDADCQYQYQ